MWGTQGCMYAVLKPYENSFRIHISYEKLAEIMGCMWGGFVHTVKNVEGETVNMEVMAVNHASICTANRHRRRRNSNNTPVIPHIRFLMTNANRYLIMEQSWG